MKVPVQFLVGMYLISSHVFAESVQQALIASTEGKVEVLTSVSEQGATSQVMMFEGQKYSYVKAKVGQKVQSKQVVLSSTDGKAKLIYAHGDVVIVGPATAVVIPIASNEKNSKKEMPLMYGKIRSVIDKEGPLSNIKIKTPSAVAGVRGTDLYVSYNPAQDKTEVQVLRGEVEVKPQVNAELLPKPAESVATTLPPKIEHKPGAEQPTYTVKASEKLVMEEKETEVVKATQQDLVKVKEDTTLVAKSDLVVSESVKHEIEKVESKAFENVVKDIRRYDESAAKALEDKKVASVDEANLMVVKTLSEKAPVAEEKPTVYELEPMSLVRLHFNPDNFQSVLYARKIVQKDSLDFWLGLGVRETKNYWNYSIGMGTSFYQRYVELPLTFDYRWNQKWSAHFDFRFLVPVGEARGIYSSQPPSRDDMIVIAMATAGFQYRFANHWYGGMELFSGGKMTNKSGITDGRENLQPDMGFLLGYLF